MIVTQPYYLFRYSSLNWSSKPNHRHYPLQICCFLHAVLVKSKLTTLWLICNKHFQCRAQERISWPLLNTVFRSVKHSPRVKSDHPAFYKWQLWVIYELLSSVISTNTHSCHRAFRCCCCAYWSSSWWSRCLWETAIMWKVGVVNHYLVLTVKTC